MSRDTRSCIFASTLLTTHSLQLALTTWLCTTWDFASMSEVRQHYAGSWTQRCHQNILKLQVSVDDVVSMKILDSFEDLSDDDCRMDFFELVALVCEVGE